jgi:predicted nucleic acid-binding protein
VRLLVPELFWCETGNIFWKAARTGRMQPASASAAVENLAALGIPSAPCQALLPDAFALATAFDRTVYDCVYIALAMRTGRKLVTADERLAAATATRLPVLWLGALGYAG